MRPILSALRHHKTAVVLVALEIALTCAIVTNALFLIQDRLGFMQLTTGVVDDELIWLRIHHIDLGQGGNVATPAGTVAADLAALRGIPGVTSVATTNGLPLTRSYDTTVAHAGPDDRSKALNNIALIKVSPDLLQTVGAQFSAGRDFLPGEYVDDQVIGKRPRPSAVVVTRSFAQQMWPGQDPLGKPVYLGKDTSHAAHVVGVLRHYSNPGVNRYEGRDRTLIMPVTRVGGWPMYVLRVPSHERDRVSHAIPALLERIDPARKVYPVIYSRTVKGYFRGDRSMVWLLLLVTGCLLALTALGVVGLTSFWVQQRTKSIGIRRAVGATRGDILRYFLVENFLIVGLGVAVGAAGAVGLNLWLMQHYELHRMPLAWLPAGALVLWALGLLSVLGPALRAARVPPVVATRSV